MRSLLRNPKLALLLTAIMAASVWVYVQRVLIPYQIADAAAHHRPRAILSDLYPRWIGTRELLLHGRDPYSTEVTQEIQTGYFGRPLDPNRPEDPKDEQRFAYPVYVVFYLAPLAKLPFHVVRELSLWGLALLTGISVRLWMRAMNFRLSPWKLGIALMLVLSSIPAVQGLKLQQLSLLVAPLLATSAALLVSGYLFLAGVFLALATVKPQLALLPTLWLMMWTFSRWRERQKLFWGFFSTMAILLAASEYIMPGWLWGFADAVVAYEHYTGGGSLVDLLATRTGGALITALAVLSTATVCWRLRLIPANSATFTVVLAIVLAVTVVIISMMAPYNQVILLPAILLITRHWRDLWERHRMSRLICTLTAGFVLWPWPTSFVLSVASFLLPGPMIQKTWAVPMWTSMGIPILILPLLYPLLAVTQESLSPMSRHAQPVPTRDAGQGVS